MNEKLKKAEEDRHDLIQMYQAGWLDGYNNEKGKSHNLTKEIKKKCIKSFEIRFMSKLKINNGKRNAKHRTDTASG